jgi:ribonuclease G
MQDILVNWTPQETRVAIVENGAVQELHLERTLERGLVGNIYAGKVARVLPGMQSAFVDIGLERAAFLHVADVHMAGLPGRGPAAARDAAAPATPIEKLVFEGQTLLVQVIKDPIGTKGARLSTQISIAGRLLVFLPQDEHIGISQKIGSPELREQLRTRMAVLVGQRVKAAGDTLSTAGPGSAGDAAVAELAAMPVAVLTSPDAAPATVAAGPAAPLVVALPASAATQSAGGFILRTNAEDATDAELADDIAYLRKTWAAIREAAFKAPAGVAKKSLLHEDLNLAQRVLRDLVNDQTQNIRIDSRLQHDALLEFGLRYTPGAVGKLQLYKGERPIFDLFGIDSELEKALSRRVDLKSGGYLVIDQTEALTTIDVNTGGFVGARNFDDTIFKTNLEASQAIARQLRLRNLGGIIIIDFIDMTREDHQHAVLSELRKQMGRDRTKTTVSGFTQLGLVEMTRKRTRESLSHMLCETCPTCGGRAHVKTARSVCYEILREILREARQFDPKEFRVIACPSVIEMLLDEESPHLAGLSEFVGKPISLQAEAGMNPEQYDIVLL